MTTAESSAPAGAQSITEHELAQCQRANKTGCTPGGVRPAGQDWLGRALWRQPEGCPPVAHPRRRVDPSPWPPAARRSRNTPGSRAPAEPPPTGAASDHARRRRSSRGQGRRRPRRAVESVAPLRVAGGGAPALVLGYPRLPSIASPSRPAPGQRSATSRPRGSSSTWRRDVVCQSALLGCCQWERQDRSGGDQLAVLTDHDVVPQDQHLDPGAAQRGHPSPQVGGGRMGSGRASEPASGMSVAVASGPPGKPGPNLSPVAHASGL